MSDGDQSRELESNLRTKVRKIGIPLLKGPTRYIHRLPQQLRVSSAGQDICVIFFSNGFIHTGVYSVCQSSGGLGLD